MITSNGRGLAYRRDVQSWTGPMNEKNGVDRDPAKTQPGNGTGKESAGERADWEARALERVRPRVERSEDEADEAGWETDTITLLENYFKSRRV